MAERRGWTVARGRSGREWESRDGWMTAVGMMIGAERLGHWLWRNRDGVLIVAWAAMVAFVLTGRLLGHVTRDGQVIAKAYEQFCLCRLTATREIIQLSPFLSIAFDNIARFVDGIVYCGVLLLLEWICTALYLMGKVLEVFIWLAGLLVYHTLMWAIDELPAAMGFGQGPFAADSENGKRHTGDGEGGSQGSGAQTRKVRKFMTWRSVLQFGTCGMIYKVMTRVAAAVL
eukprot:evm.model.scf_69EXC.2 EVM.evm.TU.scf_69EXC.2   scf_69EXC:52356-55639(+)